MAEALLVYGVAATLAATFLAGAVAGYWIRRSEDAVKTRRHRRLIDGLRAEVTPETPEAPRRGRHARGGDDV